MLKEKTRNSMEDYLCVGVFIVSMIMQKLTLRIHKSCVVSFVIKHVIPNPRPQARKRLISIIRQME
jgi:hypothetical protein